MSRNFTRGERTAGYLAYTTIGLVTGTTAALALSSLYTGGWPLPLFAGALGAVFFFAVDCLTKATPKSHIFKAQNDPEYSQFQNLRKPDDTSDPEEAPDDQSGMGATAIIPKNNVIVAIKPEQKPTENHTLKPLHQRIVKPHIGMTSKGQEAPHPAAHAAPIQNPSDNHMQR